MANMTVGTIILALVGLAIYLGVAHRILDRMRLTDKAALWVLAAIVIGSFITIPLSRGRVGVDVNIGGAIIPVGLALYVLFKASTVNEWVRALGATAIVAMAVHYLSGYYTIRNLELVDPLFYYPLIAGGVAYIAGRSRRSAFIAGVLGMFIYDVGLLTWYLSTGRRGFVSFGGAGALDVYIVSGILATLLAEVVGETWERLQGGPKMGGRPPGLLKNLRKPEFANMLAPKVDEMQASPEEGKERQDGAGGNDAAN